MKLAGIIRQDSGVGFYRIGQPINAVDKISKEKSRITPFTGTGKIVRLTEGDPNIESWTDETLMEICRDADVIWSTMITNDEEILKMLNLREWSGAKWVVDMDDDLYNIPVTNKNKYKVEAALPKIELCLQLADGLTVSVPKLKEAYQHLNPNIFVNPNGQDMKFWDNMVKKYNKKPHKKLRIGWRGAEGHGADLRLIEAAIKAIQKDYNVEFVTIGARPPFHTRHQDWVGCLDFPQALMKLDIDIALVPLVDSPYNHSKSNIAVQEFGALKIPVIASPVENQLDMPILYAKNNYEWYWEMENLIKNKKMRKQEGENLYNHIKKEWSVDGFTPALMEWLELLPRKEIKPDLT
jgi:hypothetical protein